MPRKLSEDFIGKCQWCFGEYKVNARREMVLHGYNRPGYGYTVGNCNGVAHAPFEDAHDLTEERIRILQGRVDKNKRQIKMIDGGKITKLKNPDYVAPDDPKRSKRHAYYGSESEVEIYKVGDSRFEYLLKRMKANIEGEIRFDEGIIEYLDAAVKNWTKGSIVGLDSPATGKERYVRDAYDPEKAKAAEEFAAAKATRDAKPGKITMTVYAICPDYPEWGGEHDEASTKARRDAIDAEHARGKQLKTNVKEWIKATFPADKYWVGDAYGWDITSRIRKDLRGRNLVAVTAKIDWQHLDQVIDMFPEGPKVYRKDEKPKDVRFTVEADVISSSL